MEQPPPPPQAPPNEQQLPPQQQLPPLPSAALPPPPLTSSSAAPSSLSLPASSLPPPAATETVRSPNPNLNPATTSPALNIPQSRPASQPSSSFSRPWQQPSPFQHFSLPPPPPPPGPHSASASATPSSSSLSMPPPPRGGMALGVPAHHPGPPPPPASFSSLAPPSFGQQFGGLGRNVPDSVPTSNSSQVRQPIQGMQGVGIMGAIGSSSAIRAAGVPQHPLRSITSSLRAQAVPQSPGSQNFQGHGMLRVQSVGSPISPGASQNPQSQNQPWLSSAAQGKPPLPPPSLRPQMSPQLLQQRSHIPPQHHHTMPTASPQQQHTSSAQQSQPSSSVPVPENLAQQVQPSRNQPSFPNQPPIARGQGLGIQRPPSLATLQPGSVQAGSLHRPAAVETEEPCNRILSKRSIQELVTQIDPSEKLDPDVEDILVDIAEDFVESITTFGCSLAKHRKSSVLESKDILINVERNWNISLPGFSGDEIRTYKKPFTTDIHRERLAVIKKSVATAEASNSKSGAGQGGNLKSHTGKAPANIMSPPNTKT
ncbi:PREDICTED: transcription initiation factor TFIID subunit 12 [Ipomoea nil]|uniref:transcription initiation factor TFIID subunit 12 n=1 Tax=Ipomoea nil TaxID=35883 RepID=UPI000901CE1A|nr:PREDICTED: transcription initiation factor TFIID subunit 12 [Ipomoea nil]